MPAPPPAVRLLSAPRVPVVRPPAPAGERGFSLVEMLIVLFVMALLAGIAVLGFPDDRAALRRGAERFAARTLAARDEAIVTGAPVAVIVGPAGYYFERRLGGRWQPLDGRALAASEWPDGASAALALGGAAGGGAPGNARLVFDPLGLAGDEARISLSRGDEGIAVRIARDGSVTVVEGG